MRRQNGHSGGFVHRPGLHELTEMLEYIFDYPALIVARPRCSDTFQILADTSPSQLIPSFTVGHVKGFLTELVVVVW